MSFAVTAVVAVSATVGAYSSYSSTKANNRQMAQAQSSAERRYTLQAEVAQTQFQEQQTNAMEQMTAVSRAFLEAKGKATAIQAESETTGGSAQRAEAVSRTKFSEAKGKVAREIDTNIINVANDMLANKVDTEAIIAEAESKKQNVFTNTLMGALSGASSGISMASGLKSLNAPAPAK